MGQSAVGERRSLSGYADRYGDRLASASASEEELYEQLRREALLRSEQQLGEQIGLAAAGLYGAGAGQGAAGLRGATYGAADVRQRGATEGEMLRAAEEQQFGAYYQDLLARRTSYALAQRELDSNLQGLADREETEKAKENQAKNDAEDARNMQYLGMIVGAAGTAAAGASDPEVKTNLRRDPAAEDELLASLSAELDAEGARTMGELRGTGPVRAGPTAADVQAARIADELDQEDEDTLASLRGYRYQYKDGARTPYETRAGENYGPTTDELGETELGRAALTPDGKGIDYGRASLLSLGLLGREASERRELERRVRELEAGRR